MLSPQFNLPLHRELVIDLFAGGGEMPATLSNDIARCAGVGGDEEGWREGCADCARRLAESTSEVSAWMMPPAIIAFWCEFRIEPSNAQAQPPTEDAQRP